MDHRRISRHDAAPALDRAGLVASASLRQAGTRTARIAATLGGDGRLSGGALVAVFTGRDPDAAAARDHSFHPGYAR